MGEPTPCADLQQEVAALPRLTAVGWKGGTWLGVQEEDKAIPQVWGKKRDEHMS